MKLIYKDYSLEIQPKKTEVVDFRPFKAGKYRSFTRTYDKTKKTFNPSPSEPEHFKNLQYLGFEFNGNTTYIRSSSLSRYFIKMRRRIFKTISMAYSDNSKAPMLFKKQVLSRYSHFGKRNFLSYARNASREFYKNKKGDRKEGMNSPAIRKQIAGHMNILQHDLDVTSTQRAARKRSAKVLR